MKFVYPWLLALVALVPCVGVAWVFLRARAERRLSQLVAPALRGRLLPKGPRLFVAQSVLLLSGLALMAIASSRPQWGHSAQKVQARTRNVVVALDVSRSMLAADVRPNRLERAKADISDLIDSLEADRCALVAFRRTGVLLCPLTTDHAFLRSALESATPESAARGETDLGAAVRAALDALDPAADDHNAIILVSDGGDLRGGALDAARLARRRNVPVFTVGIGDPRRDTPVPDASGTGVQQYQGKPVTVRLDEAPLKAIAEASGARYVPLATAGTAETTLGAIYRRFLRQVAAKEQAEEEELRATERFGVFLVPALLLILIAACLSRGRFAGRRTRAVAAWTLLLASLPVAAEDASASAPALAPAPAVASAPALAPTPALAPASDPASDADGAPAAEPTVTPPAETLPPADEPPALAWNRGVDAYRAGDATNALAALRPLMLTKSHGARASEVVGALEYERAKALMAEDPSSAAKAMGDAAAAMQLALRAAPQDARCGRNYTRAVDRLAELREQAHVAEVLKRTQNQDPGSLLGTATKEARALMEEQKNVLTNAAAVALRRSEALARRAATLADVWIPVKQGVLQSITNQQQAALIVGDVEAARNASKRSVEALEDLDPEAAASLAAAESACTRFWKLTALPPAAIDEDILCQTNAFLGVEAFNGRDAQRDALDFTQAFRRRFPEWAQAYEQQAQADTNKPPFTKEAQDEISALATQVEKMQLEMCNAALPPKQLEILQKLERIRELLPKDKNGGGQQNQPQNPPPQQDQDQPQDQQPPQQNDGQKPPQEQPPQPEEQKEQQAKESKDEPKTDEQVEQLLRKAQERNDEHENEKKARARKQTSPNDRDW